MVAFFVNPPEGAKHGLKLIKSKIWHHIYFKNYRIYIYIKQLFKKRPFLMVVDVIFKKLT